MSDFSVEALQSIGAISIKNKREADTIQLGRLLREIFSLIRRSEFVEDSKTAIVVMGLPRDGKSTIVNSLLDNKLIGMKANKLSVCVQKESEDEPGPEVHESSSNVFKPTRWISKKKLDGSVIYDTPAFSDYGRTPLIDTVCALYIQKLLNNLNSAKLVFVVDFNDISKDNINSFLSFLIAVENLFKDRLTDCLPNIVVVFNKVPLFWNDEPVNTNYIIGVLKTRILSSTSLGLSESSKNFVEYLTENPEQVAVFRKASLGRIQGDADADVVRAVQSIKGIPQEILKTVSPIISDSTKIAMFHVRYELTNDSFVKVESTIQNVFKDILNGYENLVKCGDERKIISSMKEKVIEITNVIKKIIDNPSFCKKIDILKSIDPKFQKINTDELVENWEIVELLEELIGLKNSNVFNIDFCRVMEKIKLDISTVIIGLELKMKEIDETEAEEKLEKIKREAEIKEAAARQAREDTARENEKNSKGFFTKITEFVKDNHQLLIGFAKEALDILRALRRTPV